MGNFDEIAEHYDDVFPSHISDHYYFKRLNFLTGLVKEGKVLDVCSGTGRLSVGLIEKGFNVTSLDSSMKMLMKSRHVRGYQPVCASAHELPFKDEEFDLVYTVAALHHIADNEKVKRTLCEMARVTKRGGCIVLWDHNPYNPYWKVLMKRVPQDTGEERLIRAKELLAPFKAATYSCKVYKKGFVPDFAPKITMKFCAFCEKLLESVPVLNLLAAHNVIVIRKI